MFLRKKIVEWNMVEGLLTEKSVRCGDVERGSEMDDALSATGHIPVKIVT